MDDTTLTVRAMSSGMRHIALLLLGASLLAACGSETPTPPPPPPSGTPVVVLPADMQPLKCADFEPPPVAKPAEKFTARRCADPDGKTRWIASFYQCADGRIWPILTTEQPTGANRPAEPTGPAYDQCLGRT